MCGINLNTSYKRLLYQCWTIKKARHVQLQTYIYSYDDHIPQQTTHHTNLVLWSRVNPSSGTLSFLVIFCLRLEIESVFATVILTRSPNIVLTATWNEGDSLSTSGPVAITPWLACALGTMLKLWVTRKESNKNKPYDDVTWLNIARLPRVILCSL